MASSAYTRSYAELAVHRTMLQDSVRMQGYYEAITREKRLFDGKVVMDVGCGTGVLAMWVGMYTNAKKVYAVEANEKMAAMAKELVKRNGLEHIVEVICKKAEDVTERVDIIVSEWMGHYLLHESMLDSVIAVRDACLAEGGLMFPNKATIFGSFAELTCAEMDGWDTSCFRGLDFQFLVDTMAAETGREVSWQFPTEPLLRHLSHKPNNEFVVAELDLNTVTSAELNDLRYTGVVEFTEDARVNCLALSFTCEFPSGVVLDTRPGRPPTHWKQTLVMLTDDASQYLPAEPGLTVKVNVRMWRPDSSARSYVLEAEIPD